MTNPLKALGAFILAGTFAALYFFTGATLTIQADGQTRVIRTHAATVEAALHEAGIPVYPADAIQPPLDSKLADLAAPVVLIDRAFVVRVSADSESRTVRTQLTSPLAILGSLGLNVGAQDEIWADDARVDATRPAGLTPPATIELRRALAVAVVDEGAAAQIVTAARTVGEALWRAGYRLYLADDVEPPLEAPLTPLLTITIHRSRPVLVQADGRTLPTRTHRGTVGEVLSDVGLALVGQDYSIPAADQSAPEAENTPIRVVRVREEILTEQLPIPFDTLYQALPDLEIDNLTQSQAGLNGVQQRLVRVRYEDGAEVARAVETENVARAPMPRIFGYGTKIVLRTIDTPEGPREYWRAVRMYATAYSPCNSDGIPDRCYPVTASGKPVKKGVVAFVRRWYNDMRGQAVFIPNYGLATVEDIGAGFPDRRYWIDLGYTDEDYVGWHFWVTVYFLTPVPANIRWILD